MQQDANKYLSLGNVYPSAPRTKRGDFSILDIANDHFLYFNGPTLIVRPLNPQNQLKYFVHKSDVLAAKFSHNGRFVASIDEKGTLMVHELGEKQLFESKKYQNFYLNARAIDWSADQKRICVVGSGKSNFGRVALIESGTNAGEISGVSANLTCCSFRPERPYNLVVGGDEYILKFYQGPPYKFAKSSSKVHSNYINSIKYSPNGKYFISVSSDKKIVLYDGSTFEMIRQKANCHERSIMGSDWIDEKTFVTVSADKTIKVWNTDLDELNMIKCCGEQEFKDIKNIEQFQVAVKVYKNKIYSLSLNGQIVEYPLPNLQDKIVEFNSEKVKKYGGWLNKPVAVLNTSTQTEKQILIVDSIGRILQGKQLTPNNLSPEISLLQQNYQSSNFIISAAYDRFDKSINAVWTDGSLSQIFLDHNHKLTEKMRSDNNKFRLTIQSSVKDYSMIGVSNKICAFTKQSIKCSQQIGQDPTSLKAFDQFIFVGTLKGNIHIFNGNTMQFITQINLSATKISCIYAEKGDKQNEYILVCGDALGKFVITKFNGQTNTFEEMPNTLGNHESLITAIHSYNSDYLLTCGMDNKINLWQRVQAGKYSRIQDWKNAHSFGILSAQIVGSSLLTVGGDYLVKQWKINV